MTDRVERRKAVTDYERGFAEARERAAAILLPYIESYRDMVRRSYDGCVSCFSVAVDIERNMLTPIQSLTPSPPTGEPSEPAAWLCDVAAYADHAQARYCTLYKGGTPHIPADKIKWTPLYREPAK